MPVVEEKNETEDDDIDQDTNESEKSDEGDENEETDSDIAESESSGLDEEEYNQRRMECLDDMADLERHFFTLREQLYEERMQQLNAKLEEADAESAPEYVIPLAHLEDNVRITTEVAGILKELKIKNIKNKCNAEEQAAQQHYLSEKSLLMDAVHNDLEEKIRRLEEDRQNIDINSDLWNESQAKLKKGHRKSLEPLSEKRRKPVSVTGPYIIYMLREADIIEDWTKIRKTLKEIPHRKDYSRYCPYQAMYRDERLCYEGDWYHRGQNIIIKTRRDPPVHATITTINATEVWVKKADGDKSKLFIAQLQKGKYSIRHC